MHSVFQTLAYAYTGLNLAAIILVIGLGVAGAVHAASTRSDAFAVIDREKQNWIMLCAGAAVLAVVSLLIPGLTMLWIIGAVIAGIYWQDVFPSIRDVLGNAGGW